MQDGQDQDYKETKEKVIQMKDQYKVENPANGSEDTFDVIPEMKKKERMCTLRST